MAIRLTRKVEGKLGVKTWLQAKRKREGGVVFSKEKMEGMIGFF